MADKHANNGPPQRNAWGRGRGKPNFAQKKIDNSNEHNTNIQNQPTSSVVTNTKFLEASSKMQAAVQRHIQDYESSSEEEELEDVKIMDSVLVNFSTGDSSLNLGRTKEFLEQSFQSGAAICLICIATIKRTQPIWNCSTCYSALHLFCVQRWAKDTIYQQHSATTQPNLGDLPVRDNSFKKIQWCCPKCRFTYSEVEVPSKYECFCRKQVNPEFHPWQVPHSCGDICDKQLKEKCGHRCVLLCHPGPCPPCPKTIKISCNCKQSPISLIRCSVASWCCNKVCRKLLNCQQHKCEQKCHDGECNPCAKFKKQLCQCKSSTESIPCAQSSWQCKKVCRKLLSCGYHKCEKTCHINDCGPCPFTGLQKCPCGAVVKEVTCPNEVSSCGGSCNKLLMCEKHLCPHKCHKDKCPQCLELVDKTCRCGLHVKQLPCSKQYTCETKCKNTKECGRHPCNKKCCSNDCLPCDKVCGRNLHCGKHKCLSVCHRGPCYPCPLTAKVVCRCSRSYITVPCGRQKKTKPPKCGYNCRVPATCKHTKENVHKCHFGACPPCKQPCGSLLLCEHKCKALCHNCVPMLVSNTKPDTPWDLQQATIEVVALPCPPCMEPVSCFCLGQHEQTKYPCKEARVTSCGRKCDRPLACQNHTCSWECHLVSIGPDLLTPVECEKCERQCSLPRQDGCNHPCGKPCHPSPCEPCHQFLKRPCHCGLTELYLQCFAFATADEKEKEKNLSCKQQCIKMLECGHRCRAICHSGDCPTNEVCTRKTRVFCNCRRIKKEVQCNLVKDFVIPCDDQCEIKKTEELLAQKEEENRRLLEEKLKNEREIAEFEKKFGKKKYKQRKITEIKNETNFFTKHWLPIASVGTLILSLLFYLFYF